MIKDISEPNVRHNFRLIWMETFTRHFYDLRHFLKCSAQFTNIYHNVNGNSRCCPAASIFGLLIIGINNFIAPDT